MPDIERYDIACYRKWRGGKAPDVEPGASGPPHGRGGAEIHRRIVSEHCLLAQQERDSQRQSPLVRQAWRGIRDSNRSRVYGHEGRR